MSFPLAPIGENSDIISIFFGIISNFFNAQIVLHLNSLHHTLLTRSQQTQAPVLPHLTFAVVVVDPHRDAQTAGFGAGAPGGGLDQTVLLPG